MIRNAWYVAGVASDFPAGKLHGTVIAGRALVMWRTQAGHVVAFDGRCRHKRFPLADGKLLEGDILECAYHGFCYNSQGACTSAPAKVSGGPPKAAQLRVFPVVEQHGIVWVWPGDPQRSASVAVPGTPELSDPAWSTVISPHIDVAAPVRLLVENLLDITHFYPLHAKNIGSYENSRIPVEIEREVIGGTQTVTTVRDTTGYQLPPMMHEWFGYETVDRRHTHRLVGPGLTRVQLRVAPAGQLGTAAEKGYVLYHLHTPVDDTHLRWRWAMNAETRWPHPQQPGSRLVDKIAEGFPGVVEEDRWALEKQQEMMLHADDGYEEVHIRTDGAVVISRRIFEQLELAEDQPDHAEIARLRTGRVATNEVDQPSAAVG